MAWKSIRYNSKYYGRNINYSSLTAPYKQPPNLVQNFEPSAIAINSKVLNLLHGERGQCWYTWNRAPGCFVKTARLDNVGVVASQWRPRSALCEQIKGTFGRRQVRSPGGKISNAPPVNDIAIKLTVIKRRVALNRNYRNQYDLFPPFRPGASLRENVPHKGTFRAREV